jgi:selenocysteine-specific elongation factor
LKIEASGIYNIVIGTAGHIDHGKSALVRALTGIDPDRLPEEKERGMTIDIGFAPFILKNGMKVSIIDVPGHEKFIKNMVAGATGIDLVILLVAANDGIMLQTREHLTIMSLLGIRRGIIAINKIDMVDKEFTDMVEEEIRDLVRGTFLENAPIMRISATTGLGMKEFRETLEKMITSTPIHAAEGVFRLPVHRVFSARGFGTIVTGVTLSGSAKVGDAVEVLPIGKTGRIRGLQNYGQDIAEARAGHTVAVNIADVDHNLVTRGCVVATPGYFKPTNYVEARLRYLPDIHIPLRHLTPIRFHSGSAEVLGRVALLESSEIVPGTEALVQIRLEEPVVVAPGDYYILRLQSPVVTLGGGTILSISADASAGKSRKFKEGIIENLRQCEESLSDSSQFVEHVLRNRGHYPTTFQQVDKESATGTQKAEASVKKLVEEGKVVTLAPSRRLIHIEGVRAAEGILTDNLKGYHRTNPLRVGIEKIPLRTLSKLDPEVFEVALASSVKSGNFVEENGLIRLSTHAPQLSQVHQALSNELEKIFIDTKLNTPRIEDIHKTLKYPPQDMDKVLLFLCDKGLIVKLIDDVYLHRSAIDGAKEKVLQIIKAKGELALTDARDVLGASRKFLIPLLEYFDQIGLTVRDGNRRLLKKG